MDVTREKETPDKKVENEIINEMVLAKGGPQESQSANQPQLSGCRRMGTMKNINYVLYVAMFPFTITICYTNAMKHTGNITIRKLLAYPIFSFFFFFVFFCQ